MKILKLLVIFIILKSITIFVYYFLSNKNVIVNSPAFLINFENKINSVDCNLDEIRIKNKLAINSKETFRITINGYTQGGYANRLYSVISAILIAILTDSALIIQWKYIDIYIEEPFELAFTNFYTGKNKKDDFYMPIPKASWSVEKRINDIINVSLPTNRTKILYNELGAYFFELSTNPVYYNKLLCYGLVSKQTIDTARKIVENYDKHSNKEKADGLLKIGFEVGGNLLNKLWIPKKPIVDIVNSYLNTSFKDYFVIGIQLRFHYLQDKTDTLKFIECALEIEANLIKNATFRNTYKGFKWFLTSDNSYIMKRIQLKYSDRVIVGIGEMGHVQLNPKYYFRTILDNELLSHCDELILTGGSTFGFIASMKARKYFYYINGGYGMKKCERHQFNNLSRANTGVGIF